MDRIGRYRIIGELGSGAMGVVYRATDPAIGRDIAIKTIRLESQGDPVRREKLTERLFREARSAGVLSHPNIVTIYDMGEDHGSAFIAMACVNGPSLEKIMAGPVAMSGGRMLSILRQTAVALDYAHSRGVVHRDVKPANIMTDEDGSVKITDFGIARVIAAQQANETGRVTGTPNYMSPEQVEGNDVDGRTDQFSLAVVVWEILTGERPFAGENLTTVVYRIVSEEPPPAYLLNGTLSPRIDEVLRRALAKDPSKRFANCASFVGALDFACAESPGWKTLLPGHASTLPTVGIEWTAPEFVPPTEPPLPGLFPDPPTAPLIPENPERSRFWPWVAGIGMACALLAAALLWQRQGAPPEPGGRQEPATNTVEAPPPPVEEPVFPPAEPPTNATVPQPGAAESRAPEPGVPEHRVPEHQVPEHRVPERRVPEPPATESEPEPASQPANLSVAPRLQDIWIRTVPAGAKAVLDDKLDFSCQTPCQLHARTGTHHITLSRAGYMNEYREIHVQESALDLPAISMRQPTATLMLTTTPPGASIVLNGALLLQTTPAQLLLTPGEYKVTVEKEGVRRTESIQVGQNTQYLRIPLSNGR